MNHRYHANPNRPIACGLLVVAAWLLGVPGWGAEPSADEVIDPPAVTDDREQMAAHVLNRLAFGPRPGQVQRVSERGWEAWAREQLAPGKINDQKNEDRIAEAFPAEALSLDEVYGSMRGMADNEARQQLRYQVRGHVRNAILVRAVVSERQFAEVICEFWRNHFSVDMGDEDVGYLIGDYERNVIRRHAFGRFEDMLMASAKHPAMLKFLDNDVSQKPLSQRELDLIDRSMGRKYVPRSVAALQRQRGLNENYARELLELHTLGVDREYTQADVTELARVLTGWTVGYGDGGDYGFVFRRDVHDDGNKRVLGATLRGGGVQQGEGVIRALAGHRYTADFIALKLCRYLVDDEPPAELVERVAQVFADADGDLPAVYEAIIFSPEFADPRYRGTKFKTPFEFVASSLRATGAAVENPGPLMHSLRTMGMPIYQCPDPTGWYDQAEAWLDPGVLVFRWQFASALGRNQSEGVRIPDALLASGTPEQIEQRMVERLAPDGLTADTAAALRAQLAENPSPQTALTLLLGSPEFQAQ